MSENMELLKEKPKDIKLIGKELVKRPALRFNVEDPLHLDEVARSLIDGKIIAYPFNGIFGFFCNADNKSAHDTILKIKNRPDEKNCVLVVPPKDLRKHVDISKTNYTHGQIAKLQEHLHALGVILPASKDAPEHLVRKKGEERSILTIWTEYHPLKRLFEKFQELGGSALAGTSANRSGQPTHIDSGALWQDFKDSVDSIVEADFSKLPPLRRQSTSIVDLTGDDPILHRAGNVSREEINAALKKFGFPPLMEKEIKKLTFPEFRQELWKDVHLRYINRMINSLKNPKHSVPRS